MKQWGRGFKKKWIRTKFTIKDGNDDNDDSGFGSGGGFKYKIIFFYSMIYIMFGRNFYLYLLHSSDFMNETLFLYQ